MLFINQNFKTILKLGISSILISSW